MRWFHDLAWAIALCCAAASLNAAEIKLKDGRVLEGDRGRGHGRGRAAQSGQHVPSQVVLIDSGLTRSYIAQRQIENIDPADGDREEKFQHRPGRSRAAARGSTRWGRSSTSRRSMNMAAARSA